MERKCNCKFLLLFLIITLLIIPVTSSQCYGCDLWDKAYEYKDKGNYQMAISTLQDALDWADKNSQSSEAKSDVWTLMGQIYKTNLKDYEQAMYAYKKAASLVMNDGYKWEDLGEVQLLYALEIEDSLPSNPTASKYKEVAELFGNSINSMNLAKNNGKSVTGIEKVKERQQYYLDLAKEKEVTKTTSPTPTPTPTKKPTPQSTPTTLSTPSPTQITIKSTPLGVDLYLDGNYVGVTPFKSNSITSGSHELTFKKDGYVDIGMSTTVIAGQDNQISVTLNEKTIETSTPTSSKTLTSSDIVSSSNGEDLIVDEISMVYYKPDTGDLTTDLRIKNIGKSPASAFRIAYFLSPEQITQPFIDEKGKEILIGADDIKSLNPREDRQSKDLKSFKLTDIPKGEYWFGVVVDSQNIISEIDENNNVLYWKEKINVK